RLRLRLGCCIAASPPSAKWPQHRFPSLGFLHDHKTLLAPFLLTEYKPKQREELMRHFFARFWHLQLYLRQRLLALPFSPFVETEKEPDCFSKQLVAEYTCFWQGKPIATNSNKQLSHVCETMELTANLL